MASTYPTTIDVFTNPLAADLLTSPSHAQQHSDINDAVEALEAKVAIGNTVLGTYTAYTPTFFNFTVGNGTIDSAYCRVNDYVHYYGYLVLGSTSSVTGSIVLTLPINCNTAFTNAPMQFGVATYRDVSAGTNFQGFAARNDSTSIVFTVMNATGTYIFPATVNATTPFTWTPADADRIGWNFFYRAA
jgi:hypothetical protein